MSATLSGTAEACGPLVLPPLRDLDERTTCMYVHTGVIKGAMQAGGERRLNATIACRRLLAAHAIRSLLRRRSECPICGDPAPADSRYCSRSCRLYAQ